MTRVLFLYGTLLPGLAKPRQAALLAGLTPLGSATVPGRLYDLGPYPALVPDATETARVRGELFALPAGPGVLAAFDAYEEYDPNNLAGSLFRRIECIAQAADGRAVPCWLWVYNRTTGRVERIADGDYRQWVADGKGRPAHGAED